MCDDCGCSLPSVNGDKPNSGGLSSQENHSHNHSHAHSNPALSESRTVEIISDILGKNNSQAYSNRQHFEKHGILSFNLMSGPGSGKTALLEKTAELISIKMAVLEGDLETNKDADRISAKGVPAYQITTGSTCHLDAFMVHEGLHHLDLDNLDLLFVENVGNLVCPASYDLGTHLNIVLLSVPEGDDKVSKYPVMFRKADLLLVSKCDLLPHFDFSMNQVRVDMAKLAPKAGILELSTKDDSSFEKWLAYIDLKLKEQSLFNV